MNCRQIGPGNCFIHQSNKDLLATCQCKELGQRVCPVHQTPYDKSIQEEDSLQYKLTTMFSLMGFFTNWDVLLEWLEERDYLPHYIHHYYKKDPEDGTVILWWIVAMAHLEFTGKNATIRMGGEKRHEKEVLEKRKKSRHIATRTQKIPIRGSGQGRYPKKPRKLEYDKRMTERDELDEAERKEEIEELTQEEVDDPESWKKRRLGVKEWSK